MRILSTPHLFEGYEPNTPELNTEMGHLDITSDGLFELVFDDQIGPETLILRCSLKPIPYENKEVTVQLTVNDVTYKPTHLYDKTSLSYGYELDADDSHLQAIVLDYTGVGFGREAEDLFDIQGNEFPSGKLKVENPLYVKPFLVEANNHHEQLKSPLGVRVLRGHGGHYKLGSKLEDIQQIYYSLTSVQDQTRVNLFSSQVLHEQHTPPPTGGHVFNQQILFRPLPTEEQYLSLKSALVAGFCSLSVEIDGEDIKYKTFQAETISGHPTLINVYFKPHV